MTALLVAWHAVRALEPGPLWRDEVHVVNWASVPSLAEVWSNRHLDAFPATWPFLIHGWISLAGASDASLRALGALVGIAGLAALWWTARQLGSRAPLFALVLYAANPCVLVFGGSVRGYGLGLLALVSFLGAAAAVAARPGWKTFALAQLTALFAAHTDFRNCVFVLAGLAGAAAVMARRRRWKIAALVLALGAIPAISLLPYLSSYRVISEWIATSQHDYAYAYHLGVFAAALSEAGAGVARIFWLVVVLALVACAHAILSPGKQDRAVQDRALFLGVTLAIGLPGIFVVLHSLRLPTQLWYYQSLIAVIAVCADGALALRGEASRLETSAKLALAACVIVLGAPSAWRSRGFVMTNVDGLAARLDQEAVPEDLILVTEPLMSPTFDRYYRGPTPWITLPEVDNPRFQDQPALREKMIRPDLRTELDRIASTLRAGHRVWMVGPLRFPDPRTTPPDPPPAPAPGTRWRDFRDAWSVQAGAVIAQGARSIRQVVPRREGAVNRFENTQLFVADPRAD